jgi:hypothetical protein
MDRAPNNDPQNPIFEWARTTEQVEVTESDIYVVLGITKYDDTYFYYLLGDESNKYPLSFPSQMFEIVDSNVSKYWLYNASKIENINELEIGDDGVISFPEWSLRKGIFYGEVIEEDPIALSIFFKYRDLMLGEHESQ